MAKKDPVQELYDRMTEHGVDLARTHRRPVHRYRASEAGACMRQIWYRLSGYRPKPRTSESNIYGVCGDADHDITRQMFKHYDIPIHDVVYNDDGSISETNFIIQNFTVETPDGPVDIIVSGRADGGIDTPRGKNLLLEIKGKGFYPFDWIQKAFVIGYKSVKHGFIKPGHRALLAYIKEKYKPNYWQVQVTMKLTKKNQCYLLYKDRSTGQLGVWNEETGERSGVYVKFEPELFEEILQRFAYVERCLQEEKPPAPEFSAGSKECLYCDFKYLCHDAADRKQHGWKPAIKYPGPQMEVYLEEQDAGQSTIESDQADADAETKD